jgi:hypothetical protein
MVLYRRMNQVINAARGVKQAVVRMVMKVDELIHLRASKFQMERIIQSAIVYAEHCREGVSENQELEQESYEQLLPLLM